MENTRALYRLDVITVNNTSIFFDRKNSSGKDISEIESLEDLKSKIDNFSGLKVDAESIYAGRIDANNTEEKAFSITEASNFFEKIKNDFYITAHANQFTSGGLKVGVDNGAVSVDHLEVITDQEDLLYH